MKILPNWQLIDEISPSLLERGIGVQEILDAALPSIISIDLSEDISNDRFQKSFRIAQMQIIYLLRSQKELLDQLAEKEKKIETRTKELKEVRAFVHSNPDVLKEVFKCAECKKVFLTEAFLTEHMTRRHPQ